MQDSLADEESCFTESRAAKQQRRVGTHSMSRPSRLAHATACLHGITAGLFQAGSERLQLPGSVTASSPAHTGRTCTCTSFFASQT